MHAVSCPVLHSEPPSDADNALLVAHYSEAEGLYRSALAAHPGDTLLTAGLVHSLLHQQKVQEAADAVHAAVATAPQNPALITLRGEVELRQGLPWDALKSAQEAEKLDVCNPRTKMLLADYARISSLYATSERLIRTAHQLAPSDPEIRQEWLMTLPLKSRIAELDEYLKQPTGEDEEDIRHLHMALEHWKKLRDDPPKPCRLASAVASTEVPMTMLMYDATHMRAFGLDVKLNNHNARLEIDTGAGGLVVTRAVAKRAGLLAFSQGEMGGIGDEGDRPAYTAYADSIRIGGLEFQNCAVEVLDSKHGLEEVDGLIGMDVLSHFLVTLDYPMRKIVLGPLPPRPGESPSAKPELKTGDSSPEEGDDDADTAQVDDKAATPDSQHDKAHQDPPPTNKAHGPWDRYVAPEMKNYVAIYRIGHDLIIPASLNASKIRLFILDTGAWTTVISPPAAREVTKVHTDDSGMEVRGVSGKVEKVYSADNVTFRFANLSQKVDRVVALDTSRISKDLGLEVSGFIGATTLELVTMHIDYRDGLVKFDYDPNRGYKF
jgi:predicted aspartyl protease